MIAAGINLQNQTAINVKAAKNRRTPKNPEKMLARCGNFNTRKNSPLPYNMAGAVWAWGLVND